MRNRSQLVRRVVTVVGGLGLAAGAVGVAGALQANASTTGQTTVAAQPVVAKKITVTTNGTYVPLWAKVTLSGKTTGIKANSVVQVQRLEGTKWVNFPATTKVTSKATYAVKVASGRAGVNKFRVVSSSTISPVVSITFAK